MNKVLIVTASEHEGRMMSGLLKQAGYDVLLAGSVKAGEEAVKKLPPGSVIVSDMKLGTGNARELIDWMKMEGRKLPLIVVMDRLDGSDVLDMMKSHGAVDIIQRPAMDKQLVETVARYVKTEIGEWSSGDVLIPRDTNSYRKLEHQIEMIAKTNRNCIIFGESGVGKLHVAHQIVELSARRDKTCSVIEAGGAEFIGYHDPKTLRSELYNRIEGYFEDADGGTIIIKNIQLLSLKKQSVILHILENEHPDVRVICTAEPDLIKMVDEKRFRSNLFFILRSTEIEIPPLRDNVEDIEPLSTYFLTRLAESEGRPIKRLDASAIKKLRLRSWPGNVRELKDAILLAAHCVENDIISADDFFFSQSEPDTADDLRLRNERQERDNILKAYERTGTWIAAANMLGISDRTLRDRRKALGISKNGELEH